MSDFIIPKGTDSGIQWPVLNLDGTEVNFTGWTGTCQIRALNSNKLLHTFSTGDTTMILDDSKVTLVWTSTETSTWTWKTANFGIELVNPQSKRVRFMQGIVILSEEFVK